MKPEDKKKNYIVTVKHKTLGTFQSGNWQMSEAEAADLHGSVIMFRNAILDESIIFLEEVPEDSK